MANREIDGSEGFSSEEQQPFSWANVPLYNLGNSSRDELQGAITSPGAVEPRAEYSGAAPNPFLSEIPEAPLEDYGAHANPGSSFLS